MPSELDRSGPRSRSAQHWTSVVSTIAVGRDRVDRVGLRVEPVADLLRSRRMCHAPRGGDGCPHGDAEPVPLFGEVSWCEYIGEGLYRTDVALAPLPEGDWLVAWLRDRKQRSHV